MGHFKDEADVYAFIGRHLEGLANDPELGPALRRANTTARFEMTDPDARVTILLRPEEEARVDMGASELDPEVIMTSSADTAHNFWLGRVNITAALASGEMTALGPVAKLLRLVPLVEPSFPRYEQMLRDAGRLDLLEAV